MTPDAMPLEVRHVPKSPYGNPWGLTLRQCQIAASLVRLCRVKEVADYLDMSDKNVYYALGVIGRKMGQAGQVGVALEYDRWVRAQTEQGRAPLPMGPWTPL